MLQQVLNYKKIDNRGNKIDKLDLIETNKCTVVSQYVPVNNGSWYIPILADVSGAEGETG